MRTIFDSRLPVKSDPSFGASPARGRRMPYTQPDLDWAAQFFCQLDDERRLEERALQAQWDDQSIDSIPVTGHCLLCGDRCDDPNFQGLCHRCDDVACNAAIAGENARAGPGPFATRARHRTRAHRRSSNPDAVSSMVAPRASHDHPEVGGHCEVETGSSRLDHASIEGSR